ncbi:ABC transporter, ATP binding domain, possibly Mn transporter [Richelia intracellularis HM01]|uniref:ATP-binding cassette domain-containing protein n=1 Tax=Richelia intracellularis TaxID=1164990 RepID=UPI0002B58653|nr:ATP-binding cassette domain-containing protein [Richelia intracellularis]CCH66088.1 ABC transporter, ATP binding domain, possibly Mn transporter [Richelia intracellularis HM01]
MSITTVRVENVTVSYNGKVALYRAKLELKSGSIIGLVGMNGSGKSTLFKVIMGFVPHKEGYILIKGNAYKKGTKAELGCLYTSI